MTQPHDDFYVGYLPIPPRTRRFALALLPLLVASLGVAILGAGLAQRDPGDGVWETGDPRTWEGTLVADPYPRLVRDDGTIFLVDFGKKGAQRRAEPWLGRRVRVSGWLLRRDGRRIVELEPNGAVQAFGDLGPPTRTPASTPLGDVELVGEIMDSKCYLGAMKPGDGKGHKACATLCIAGGIPPALVVRDASGAASYYVVIADDGGRADDVILEYVGEPVRVRGTLERRGDTRFLRVGEGSVERL